MKYVENEYCAKHGRVPVNKHKSLLSSNLIRSAKAPGSCQTSLDPYDLCSDDEEYLAHNIVSEMTPRRRDRTAHPLTPTRLSMNSPPEAPKDRGQIDPNLTVYHSDPMEISSTFLLPDITDWWSQQEELHSKHANLSNVAREIFSIIPHHVRVEASISRGQDVIGWRQSKTTGGTLHEKGVVRQFAQAYNTSLAGAHTELDTPNSENYLERRKEAEERQLHRVTKVHNCLEMWQGSQTYVPPTRNLALKTNR